MNERRRKIVELFSLVVILLLFFGYPTYFFILNYSLDIKHETNRWMMISDNDGNKIAVEAINISLWDELASFYQLYQNSGEQISIWGVITSYNNTWQFRLAPETLYFRLGIFPSMVYPINEIADNLEMHLSTKIGFYVNSIQFINFRYAGVIPFIIDMVVTGVSILLFSLYFYFKRERRLATKIKEELLITKKSPEGISFTDLSQKIGLKEKRIKSLIHKRNLVEDLGLQITDDKIKFKAVIYSKSINQIEDQLPYFTQLSNDQLTLDHYSQLFQFKTDLEEALVYFSKDSSNVTKQTQIEATLEVITDLLESIT